MPGPRGSVGGAVAQPNVGAGWRALIEEFNQQLRRLDGEATVTPSLDWGMLVFRIHASPSAPRRQLNALKHDFEARAARTCEACGASGEVRGGVVVTILCDACFA